VLALSPGSVFAAKFRIVRPLGEGGMGRVYVALQLATGKERALKVMRPELVGNETLRQRFVQEAKIGARIASDHVVEVVDAGVDEETGAPWMAMELLEGETLAQAIEKRIALDAPTARDVFSQLCHAVGAAHDASVVHRDLKPDNVFLARTRREGSSTMVKVLDLGIAKLVADARTQHTETIGTPLWMAPEQTEAGEDVRPATDVWALGLIAFTMLTGRFYWKSAHQPKPSQAALLREIVLEPIVRASERAQALGCRGRIPEHFDEWFAKCVARKPSDRFKDAHEARAALDPILANAKLEAPARGAEDLALARTAPSDPHDGQPSTDSTTGRISSSSDAEPKRTRPMDVRMKGLIAGGMIGALMFAGVAMWRATKKNTNPNPPPPTAWSAPPAPSPSSSAADVPALVDPLEGKVVTETPIELRWAPGGTTAHEIEIERTGDTAQKQRTWQFPAQVSYALWPWTGVTSEPGAYRFRVRNAGSTSWSAWRTFFFYRSILDRITDQKKLRVAMELTYHEPFVYIEPGAAEKVVGFDVDLAQKLAESLGATFERVPREWGQLFTGLQAHEFDVVISAISVTDERKLKYAFSTPYLQTGQRISTLATSARHFKAGDKGFTLGFQTSTTSDTAAHKLFPAATHKGYETLDSVFAALSRKEIDAIMCDEVIARARPEHRDGRYRLEPGLLTHEGYGVMMSLGDEALRTRIDLELKKLADSGFLKSLETKYGTSGKTKP